MATKKPAPKKAATPSKKSAPAKKSVPAKKAAPVKKAAPAKKIAPAKKAAPIKKAAPAKKVVAPAKKAAPAKKVVAPVKKTAPAKKVVAPAKKAAPAKVAPLKVAPAKKAAPAVVAPVKVAPAKKPAPVTKVPEKVAPEKKAAPAPKAAVKAAPAKPVAAPQKPVSAKPDKKKIPAIAPETRFAETSKPASSPALLRKALREKGMQKETKVVAMPKINTKSARKYEPEFTRSVLDQKEVVAQSGPSMRYSDAELAEFRELINSKLDAAKRELTYLNGLITRKDTMSGEDSDNRYMTMEDGSLSMEREQLNQMASRQIDFIAKLEKAMMRIENKTYGICRVTGNLIDKARLKAVPHATLSMEAKMNMRKN